MKTLKTLLICPIVLFIYWVAFVKDVTLFQVLLWIGAALTLFGLLWGDREELYEHYFVKNSMLGRFIGFLTTIGCAYLSWGTVYGYFYVALSAISYVYIYFNVRNKD